MIKKPISVIEEDWDHLIILDACRYDYFEKMYKSYLDGKFRKVISPGSETSEWCRKVFQRRYDDVVYVSANPRINSKVEVRGFNARKHFHRIIDVWDWGWDDKLGTVRPEVVNEAALKARDNYPDKRLIVHYMQPHAPYLSLGALDYKMDKDPFSHRIDSQTKRLRSFLGSKLRELLGAKRMRKLRDLLGLQPLGPLHAALREVGEDGLRQAYEENVRIVLEHTAKLVGKLSGKIVVTADHGELLGEDGYYAHPRGKQVPILVEVPWLEIEGRTKKGEGSIEKCRIKRKIRKLKRAGKLKLTQNIKK